MIHRRLYSTLLLSLTLAVGLTTVYAQSSSPKKLAATAAYAGNDQAMALADQIASASNWTATGYAVPLAKPAICPRWSS